MTKVVNIHYENYDVYIGRGGRGMDGYFGNSHRINYCVICSDFHTREQSVAAYKKDFDRRISVDPEFKKRIIELKDKTLGCFCKQKNKEVPCHGDIICNYLNSL